MKTRKSQIKALCLVLSAVILVSCKGTQVGTLGTQSYQATDFKYATMKHKIGLKSPDKTISFSMDTRLKNSDTLWMNLSKSGFTGGRTLVTKDSMFVLNKLGKSYIKGDFKVVEEKLGQKVSLIMLQNLLLGNLIMPLEEYDKIKKKRDSLIISQDRRELTLKSVVSRKEGKIHNAVLISKRDGQEVFIKYSNFKIEKNNAIPGEIVLETIVPNKADSTQNEGPKRKKKKGKATENIDKSFITIELQKVEFKDEGLSFPFRIPSSYVKMY